MRLEGTLVLMGAGKMGGAMLEGWLARGIGPNQIAVIDPAPPEEIAAAIRDKGIALNPPVDSIETPRVVVIAVKPQVMGEALPGVAPLAPRHPLFISVAAGKTVASFEEALGADAAVVRAMPNTPAAVGRGITVICPNRNVSEADATLAEALLSTVGEVARIDDEALMDAVTAVSGSGPAYVFYLAECLAEAGVKAGLPEELADRLARATVAGAGELLHRSDLPAETLRQNVTSPGGTTAAALGILMSAEGLRPLMDDAVAAAARRSRELAS